jgi:hypothetical protein
MRDVENDEFVKAGGTREVVGRGLVILQEVDAS